MPDPVAYDNGYNEAMRYGETSLEYLQLQVREAYQYDHPTCGTVWHFHGYGPITDGFYHGWKAAVEQLSE